MKNWTKYLLPNAATWLIIGLLLAVQSVAARPALQQGVQEVAPTEKIIPTGQAGILSPSSLLFSYQGQLLDADDEPIDGSIGMTFSLYHEETGGTAFWTETYTATEAISVTNGLFQVLLGSLVPIDPAELTGDVYLELAVNGETLSPRELLTSVAHAVEAGTVPDGSITNAKLSLEGGLGLGGDGSSDAQYAGSYANLSVRNYTGNIRSIAADSMYLFIDSDNDSTDAEFRILKNNHSLVAPVEQIFKVAESGDVTVHGSMYVRGDLLHINSDADTTVAQIKFGNNDLITYDDTTLAPGSFSLDVDGNTGNALLLAGGAYLNSAYDSSYRLKAGGNAYLAGNLTLDGSGQSIFNNPQDVTYSGGGALRLGSGSNWLAIDNNEIVSYGDDLHLQGSSATTAVYAHTDLYVDGSVGIGTVSPSQKLEVNGAAKVGTDLYVGGTTYLDGNSIQFRNASYARLRSDVEYIDFLKVSASEAEGIRAGKLGIDSSYANANTKLAALGGNSLWVKDKLQTGSDIKVGGFLHLGGTDFIMDEFAGRGGGRAMVNDNNDTLTINYAGDFAGGVRLNGPVTCGAIVEANLQTEDELDAGGTDRFEEGDVLCWGMDQLELCTTSNDRLVQAVADAQGRPIIIGAEAIKVIGPVKRGDILVASGVPSYAMVNNDPVSGSVIAQALEDFEGGRGLIKAMIRKF